MSAVETPVPWLITPSNTDAAEPPAKVSVAGVAVLLLVMIWLAPAGLVAVNVNAPGVVILLVSPSKTSFVE